MRSRDICEPTELICKDNFHAKISPRTDGRGFPTLVYSKAAVFKVLRTMTCPEAMLIIYEELMVRLSHVVFRMGVHEEDKQMIFFEKGGKVSQCS